MRLPKSWTPHSVGVEPYVGESANGAVFSGRRTVEDVYVKDQQEVVVDGTGAEVLSRASVRFNLDDLPPIGSKVTVWEGTPTEYSAVMFKVSRLSHPGWPAIGVGWLR